MFCTMLVRNAVPGFNSLGLEENKSVTIVGIGEALSGV